MSNPLRSACQVTSVFGIFAAGALAQDPLDGDAESARMLAGRSTGTLRVPSGQESSSDSTAWDWARPDARPPVGVTFTDTLDAKEWMVYVRYLRTEQDGFRDDMDDLSSQEIFDAGYEVAAEKLSTNVLDLQMFYGWDERWTLFAELPWIARKMDNKTEGGDEFETEANGIGDLTLGTVRALYESDGRKLVANLGLSIPTGSVDEADHDQDGERITLPYSMQIGSGTYDVHPGISWLVQYDTWSWGAQGQWRLHTGRNDEDWARSDEGDVSAWVAKGFSPSVSGSLRLRGYFWGDIHGQDDELDPTVSPLNDHHRQGGERYDLVGGLTWQLGGGYETVRTLSVEVGKPVVEWLDGPGLSTDIYLILGWRYSF